MDNGEIWIISSPCYLTLAPKLEATNTRLNPIDIRNIKPQPREVSSLDLWFYWSNIFIFILSCIWDPPSGIYVLSDYWKMMYTVYVIAFNFYYVHMTRYIQRKTEGCASFCLWGIWQCKRYNVYIKMLILTKR
jgi:hypothetical protein